jgi:hypothetical protein
VCLEGALRGVQVLSRTAAEQETPGQRRGGRVRETATKESIDELAERRRSAPFSMTELSILRRGWVVS